MKDGIQIKIIWLDVDVLEILFNCSNNCFSGQAEIYLSHDGLSEIADKSSGFPSHPEESRDFEMGTFLCLLTFPFIGLFR